MTLISVLWLLYAMIRQPRMNPITFWLTVWSVIYIIISVVTLS